MFYVTTTDQRRRAHWMRLFGVDQLPVKAPRPRRQARIWQPGEVLAFDLDAGRLHWMQRHRFAGYVSRQIGVTVDEALHLVDGWPIPADGVTAVSWWKRPFAFTMALRIAH